MCMWSYGNRADVREQPADEAAGPKGYLDTVQKVGMSHFTQWVSGHASGFRQYMMKCICHALRIVTIGMAKSDDEANLFFLELTVAIDHAFAVDHYGFLETDRAGIELDYATKKADNCVIYF